MEKWLSSDMEGGASYHIPGQDDIEGAGAIGLAPAEAQVSSLHGNLVIGAIAWWDGSQRMGATYDIARRKHARHRGARVHGR